MENQGLVLWIKPNVQVTYRVNSWVPEPSEAANRDLYLGYLNTSP